MRRDTIESILIKYQANPKKVVDPSIPCASDAAPVLRDKDYFRLAIKTSTSEILAEIDHVKIINAVAAKEQSSWLEVREDKQLGAIGFIDAYSRYDIHNIDIGEVISISLVRNPNPKQGLNVDENVPKPVEVRFERFDCVRFYLPSNMEAPLKDASFLTKQDHKGYDADEAPTFIVLDNIKDCVPQNNMITLLVSDGNIGNAEQITWYKEHTKKVDNSKLVESVAGLATISILRYDTHCVDLRNRGCSGEESGSDPMGSGEASPTHPVIETDYLMWRVWQKSMEINPFYSCRMLAKKMSKSYNEAVKSLAKKLYPYGGIVSAEKRYDLLKYYMATHSTNDIQDAISFKAMRSLGHIPNGGTCSSDSKEIGELLIKKYDVEKELSIV